MKIISRKISESRQAKKKEHNHTWDNTFVWCEQTVDIHFDMDGREFILRFDWHEFFEFADEVQKVKESDLALNYIAKTLVKNWEK